MSNASQKHETQKVGAAEWQQLLFSRTRQRAAGRAIATVGKAAVMDLGSVAPRIDVARMSASATITTPTPDRSEDVVHPEGVLLENYRRNPVVFYDHGFSGIMLPIGKSEDPDGNLTLVVKPDGIDATTYFAQSLCEACQVFALIEEGIVKSTSIGFMPLEALPRTANLDGGRPGLEITVWELLEYSWVGIPDNPEAVRKVLDRGRLAGSPICEPILKSLTSFAAPVVRTGRGWEQRSMNPTLCKDLVPEDDTFSEPSPPLRERGRGEGEVARDRISKSSLDAPSTGLTATLSSKAGESSREEAHREVGELVEETEPETIAEKPLGAQVFTAVFDGLTALSTQITAALGPLENPQVKDHLTKLSDLLRGCLGEMQSAYSTTYPDAAELQGQQSPDVQSLAKFLGASAANRRPVASLVQQLKTLQVARNLTTDQRAALAAIGSRLSKLTHDAHLAPDTDAHAAELAEVKRSVKALVQRFEEIMPARRNE